MYVITYDIAEPGRLRRVARLLERHATRVQKSVFLYHGDEAGLNRLLDEVAGRMDVRADVIQAWRTGVPGPGVCRGSVANLNPPAVVLGAEGRWVLEEDKA